jgi:hypothetical protein
MPRLLQPQRNNQRTGTVASGLVVEYKPAGSNAFKQLQTVQPITLAAFDKDLPSVRIDARNSGGKAFRLWSTATPTNPTFVAC